MGALSSSASGVAAGTVAYFGADSAPAGWLKANGAAVSRTLYAGLFAVIGTTHGAGDGVTTFNIPDIRGEFLRGLDDGRGVDAARVIGSAQAGQNVSHQHRATSQGGVADGYAMSAGAGAVYPVPWGLGSGTPAVDTGLSGGTEARPRNVALLACIKY